MNSPMGAQDATLSLAADGAALSGKIVSSQGTQEFAGGSVDGSSLAWKVKMTQPMPMELDFSATVEGDGISGNAKLGMFGNATFSGTRV
ncbi:hypothetical protein N9K35_07120 [Pseudomonadales bacterium]|nr:hypothetical protein [Pseudomonadales bacterium]MDA9298465.1 hypothetical protein [Pseudomonadales bacterium]